jgi:hypothetical protein
MVGVTGIKLHKPWSKFTLFQNVIINNYILVAGGVNLNPWFKDLLRESTLNFLDNVIVDFRNAAQVSIMLNLIKRCCDLFIIGDHRLVFLI